MRLIFKRGIPVNSNGPTMVSSIYNAAAEMKLNKPKKHVQASKRVITTDYKYPMDTLRSHVIDDQQKWDSTLSLRKSDYLKYNILNA